MMSYTSISDFAQLMQRQVKSTQQVSSLLDLKFPVHTLVENLILSSVRLFTRCGSGVELAALIIASPPYTVTSGGV